MRGYGRLVVPIVIYGLICLFMTGADFTTWLYLVMIWNVFLASLPLIFALKADGRFDAGKNGRGVVLLLLWLLFYPNAVYMTTDMIHISGYQFFVQGASPYATGRDLYSADILLWCRLIVIAAGTMLSMLMGLESMRLVYRRILKHINAPAAVLSSMAISVLGGYGVYLGRFLRLNSWDVLMPANLVRRILNATDCFALLFALCYGGFILLAFFCYYLVVDSAGKSIKMR